MRSLAPAALALVLAACGREAPPTEEAAAPSPAATAPADAASTDQPAQAERWAGRWLGPEGLFLQIDPAGEGRYRLTLKDNLDSEATYDAQVAGDGLQFVRRGETLTIRSGSGAETGFKWLADKKDCLIVVPGREGYCRD